MMIARSETIITNGFDRRVTNGESTDSNIKELIMLTTSVVKQLFKSLDDDEVATFRAFFSSQVSLSTLWYLTCWVGN